MNSTSALGRLTRKLVKLSRMVQISGKMLTAKSRMIDGATNSQAIDRSDSPRMRRAIAGGVARAARSIGVSDMILSYIWEKMAGPFGGPASDVRDKASNIRAF